MILSDEPPGGVSRQPVAGDGPHGGASVVDVVAGVAVVDVVEVVLVDVLLVLEEVLLVEVVEDVEDVDVVVGGPPISQFAPEMPGGQMQRYPLGGAARQVPPFRHGLLGAHGVPGSVVVVVVPAVHVDEPGGADVPAGHGAHAVAAPVANVSAGQARQAAAPSDAACVPAAQGAHDVAPAAPALVPAGHGAHAVAPALAANVPGKQDRHGWLPDALNDPGWQGCAEVGTA